MNNYVITLRFLINKKGEEGGFSKLTGGWGRRFLLTLIKEGVKINGGGGWCRKKLFISLMNEKRDINF